MKRYWKLSLLVLMIVGSLATLYTKQVISMSGLPQYTIKTLQGDPKELSSIEVSGDYSSDTYSYPLYIDQSGTHYQMRSAFWASTGYASSPTVFKQLIKHYHHFMRGKGSILNYFYEDDQELVYASTDSRGVVNPNTPNVGHLRVSILNKKTMKETNLSLPLKSVSYYINVYDVQRVGNLLKIVTQNQLVNGGMEIHVLTVDPNKQTLIKDETVGQTPPDSANKPSHVTALSDSVPLKPNHWMVLLKQQRMNKDKTFMSYNLVSGVKKTLSLPKQIPSAANVLGLEGTTLYLYQTTSIGETVYSFNIESGQLIRSFQVDLPSQPKNQAPASTVVRNGKVYIEIPYSKDQEATLIIKDSRSGKTLYKGQLVKNDGSRFHGKLQLYGIDFK